MDEPRRSTLEKLQKVILGVVPEAEQSLAYGVPAFKLGGKPWVRIGNMTVPYETWLWIGRMV